MKVLTAMIPRGLEPATETEIVDIEGATLPPWLQREPRGDLVLVHGFIGDTTYEHGERKVYISPEELKAYYEKADALRGFADIEHRGPDSRIGDIIGQRLTTVKVRVGDEEVEKPVIDYAVDVTEHRARQNIRSRHWNATSPSCGFIPTKESDGLEHAKNLTWNHGLNRGPISFVHEPQKFGHNIYKIYKRGDT